MSIKLKEQQIMYDRCNMKIIYNAFEKLSPQGKGVCAENIVRMLTEKRQ